MDLPRLARWVLASTLLWVGIVTAGAVSAQPPGAASPPITGPPELQVRGADARAALVPLKKGLMSTLQAALEAGPEAAVDACRLSAPGIAEGAATDLYTVGRTSDRLRSPANAPAPWMQSLLARFEASPPAPGVGTVVELEGGAIGYVEPIFVQPLCITCHGASVEPTLHAHIRERYPDDAAIGYAVGDFRGLFWVVGRAAR